jgi:hypothetical protein
MRRKGKRAWLFDKEKGDKPGPNMEGLWQSRLTDPVHKILIHQSSSLKRFRKHDGT